MAGKKGFGEMVAQARSQRRSTSAIDEEAIARQALANLKAAGNEAAATAIAEALRSPDSTVIAASGQSQTIIRSADSADSEELTDEDDAPTPVAEESELAESVRLLQEEMAEINRNQQGQLRRTEEQLAQSRQEVENARAQLARLREQLTQSQAATEEAQQRVEELEPLQRLTELQGRTNFDTDERRSAASPRYSGTGVNVQINPARNHPHGFAKDFMEMRSQVMPHDPILNQKTQTYMYQYDPKEIDRMVKEIKADRAALKDMESWFKANGLLLGRNMMPILNAAGPTIGTPDSVGAVFLDVLSSMVRQTHRRGGIFWQFVMTLFDPTVKVGSNLLVPRWNFLEDPDDPDDYELASSSGYTAIAPAYGTDSDSQSLGVSTVSIENKEYGLGKGNKPSTRPVFIPAFHSETNLFGMLDAILESRLLDNYLKWEELWIRREYEKSTQIRYNKGGELVTDATQIAAGDGGIASLDFLSAAYSEMFELGWPTFPETDSYVLAASPRFIKQLKSELRDLWEPPNGEQVEAMTNILRAVTRLEIERPSNYVINLEGFAIFAGNTFGVGKANSSPTSLMTNFGAGAFHTVDSFAIAPGCVGHGVSAPFAIQPSGWNAYGRGESTIWTYRGGVNAADLDAERPDAREGEQTRCLRLRTSKLKI